MPVKMLEVPVHQARVLLCNSKADAEDVLATWYLGDDEEFEAALKVLHGGAASSFERDGKGNYHLLYSPKKNTHIAHEAVHIGFMVFDNIGVNLSSENDEPLAYMVDHIIGAFYERKGWQGVKQFLKKEAARKRGKNGRH